MSAIDATVVLQARMASARLPGKALLRIGARTLLGRCLDRLIAGRIAPVLLATTTNPEDDALEAEARARGVPTVRGPVDDVLGRFVLAVASRPARFVIRATADNPAVDIDAPGRVLGLLTRGGADYVCERDLPYGAAVEALTVDALRAADREATAAADREHVTTFIKRDPARFAVVAPPAPAAVRRPDIRLTVDTADDLRFMRDVLTGTDGPAGEPSLAAIIARADALRVGGDRP